MRDGAVLEDIQTLPRAERQASGYERNCETGLRQRGTDMRGHVVRSFRHVTEANCVFGNEMLEEISHVERHVGICVLLNHKRTGRVLDEDCKEAICDACFGSPIGGGLRKRVEALASSRNGEGGIEDHARIWYVRDPQHARCYSTVTLLARFLG